MVELTNMSIKEATFICFIISAIVLLLAITTAHLFFKWVKRDHPNYYKKMGEPIILAPTYISEETYSRLLKGGAYGYIMVFRGVPKDFPRDVKLRKLAHVIRLAFTCVIILFSVLVVLGYFFYNDTK